MKDTLRIPRDLLEKLAHIAAYEGRTKNKEFEAVNGPAVPVNKQER